MSDKKRDYPNGRCCVFQPFDNGGAFDKRFDDVLAPAVEAADLEPYRVDRDAGSVIPVDTLHKEIKSAAACIADITTRNPNVMYELGYAIAAGKDVVIISGPNPEKYPFDIQHRGILPYAAGSISDFNELKQKLTEKLNALLELRKNTAEIADASPVKESAGLQPHELTALALLFANSDTTEDAVAVNWIKQEMRKAGFTEVGTRIALTRLIKLGYVTSNWRYDGDERWAVYGVTEDGEAWLLENQAELQVRVHQRRNDPSYAAADLAKAVEVTDDDIPF
jgi:hypothetical protein